MRQVTEKIVAAFNGRKELKVDNSYTDGRRLFLFGNKIAEWDSPNDNDVVWITSAGWKTPTTKDRLNALDGVSIQSKKGEWYLNGVRWDGQWVKPISGGYEEGYGWRKKTRDEEFEAAAEKDNPFKTMIMVAKMGEVLNEKKEDQNKWKQRMMKAQFGEGVNFPEDWDTLSEEEKERRLNGALEQLK